MFAGDGDFVPLVESVEQYQQQYPDLFKSLQPSSGTQAIAALPLIVNEQTLGSITMGFKKPTQWSQPERSFMMTLAQQTAQALKRALLSERTQEMAAVQERQRLAQDLHDSVSQALFSATTIASYSSKSKRVRQKVGRGQQRR